MKILIDTHVLLWSLYKPSLLSKKVRYLLEDPNSEVYFSSISSLEISVKILAKKLEANLNEVLEEALAIGFKESFFSSKHAIKMLNIPSHHFDPFDRAIIAQAISEELSIVSKDRLFSSYEIDLIW